MTSWLRDWLDEPHPDRGVYLATEEGDWDYRSYPEIASSAKRVAAALEAEGVGTGDVVCAIIPTDYQLISTYFGVWASGAVMCLITPPLFQTGEEYVDHVAAILRQAEPKLTIASADLAPLTKQCMERAGIEGEPWLPREAETEAAVKPASELALLQFTSGSSGEPRGVRVTWENLEANTDLIARFAEFGDGDEVNSWLPLYHDMGLIGAFLTPVTRQGTLHLMRPDQWIRDPKRWLDRFSRAQFAGCPPFAFTYMARRLKKDQLEGLDLTGWKSVIVGAEPVDPAGLSAFAELLKDTGFKPTVFRPAYGMAETTLCVTMFDGSEPPLAVRPDPESLNFGERVRVTEEHRVGLAAVEYESGWMVGCGAPDPALPVRICDEYGKPLPDGHLGEIVAGGASACDGYYAGAEGKSTRFVDGEVWTGDAGFLYKGQLFVLGRMGDSLKVRGRSVYVEDLEAKLSELTGLHKGRITVVAVPGVGSSGVALFVEADEGDWTAEARRFLARRLDDASLTIVTGPRGLIERTSSGKPRRRHMYERLQAGTLSGIRVLV
ncbi:acyl-CoA synthetase (AMP-forming)/AMP-acid ligase II [Actinocorallia herbida]|uniref:Acyl-CoA synthetase (AMP-forming)/AMP-acid ligase II n=1 Tax=Actinocorallia herbida TaxID=58109 RepID=A0A3N1CPF7_9ACTN|nr:AMP-binding protein [Actinocorallia herbida]ROO83163.1 acyl-CoA synthetase (AMP-forming)/AMP-acid ligase II [Actinocorallia herbida]